MSVEPKHMQIARVELQSAVREIPGKRHHPRVLAYHASTKLQAATDETPWCASFVNWCLQQAGMRTLRSARAADYSALGVKSELRPGAVVVFGRSDPDAGGSGHVAFFVRNDGPDVLVLGGNQSNAVTIARRPRSRITAVRWPVPA